VLILFIINIIFSIRLVRSLHPTLGWHPGFSIAFKFLCVLIGMVLIMVISGTVQSFYTLDPTIKNRDRQLQLYGSTFLAVVATLPLPATLLSVFIPYSPPDRFGVGRLRTKVIVLLVSTTLLSLGAWYRCGSTFAPPVPRSQPLPSYLGKGAFYMLNFFVEIQTVLMYAILRVDLRWHVPNGAHGAGSYSASSSADDVEMQDSRPSSQDKNTTERKSSTAKSITLTVDTALANSPVSTTSTHRTSIDPEKAQALFSHPPTPQTTATSQSITTTTGTTTTAAPSRSLFHSIFARSSTASSLAPPAPPRPTTPSTRPPSSRLSAAAPPRLWRTSEHERVVSRLGGPWLPLSSPVDRVPPPYSPSMLSPAQSTFSRADESRSDVGASVVTGDVSRDGDTWRASVAPPTLPDPTAARDWSPALQWELKSPRRFLSMKKRVTRELL
jgi:hypothetical protein